VQASTVRVIVIAGLTNHLRRVVVGRHKGVVEGSSHGGTSHAAAVDEGLVGELVVPILVVVVVVTTLVIDAVLLLIPLWTLLISWKSISSRNSTVRISLHGLVEGIMLPVHVVVTIKTVVVIGKAIVVDGVELICGGCYSS